MTFITKGFILLSLEGQPTHGFHFLLYKNENKMLAICLAIITLSAFLYGKVMTATIYKNGIYEKKLSLNVIKKNMAYFIKEVVL